MGTSLTSLFVAALVAVSGLSAVDMDTDRFFKRGPVAPPANLPADRIYPQGQLFPFSFYSTGGGTVGRRGARLPKAERERAEQRIMDFGVTLIGPQYELNEESLEVARRHGVKVVTSIVPRIDGDVVDREYVQKRTIDFQKLASNVAEQVKTLSRHAEIAWWDITPEELRWWEAQERRCLEVISQSIRKNDPLGRPVFMYEPNHRTAQELSKLLPYQDLSVKGMYVNFSGFKDQRYWTRHSVAEQLKAIGLARSSAIAIALPEMFQQPLAAEASQIESWVRYDIYSALLAGARGVLVFSASERPGFPARDRYLEAYGKVARQLTRGEKLGEVLLFGSEERDVTAELLDGPETVELSLRKGKVQLPSFQFKSLAYRHRRYVFLVNSASDSLELVVSGLVYGSGVTVRNLLDGSAAFTAPEGDFTVSLKPLEVAVFSIYNR